MNVHCSESCSPVIPDLRIVLLGKTGSGKSSTGNTILGKKAFHTEDISKTSVTIRCLKQTSHFDDRTVSVIDTPGVFDTSMTDVQLRSEMEKCITLSVTGPHIFLLVISLMVRFTEEEKNTVKWIKDNFGEAASKHILVIFTGGDKFHGKSVNLCPRLMELIDDCEPGYLVFDNTRAGNHTQVFELFEKIDEVVERNGNHYTSEVYQRAQRKIIEDEKWRSRGNTMETVGNGLMVAAVVVAAVAPPGLSLAARVGSAFMATGVAGMTKVLGKWMKPKEDRQGESS